MPTSLEKQVLTAPDPVARAAAGMAQLPEQRWMLRQSREVRLSFAQEVFGHADMEQRQQVWMLNQPREIRESFIQHVLSKDSTAEREMIWILRQDDDVCRSFARFVLQGEEDALPG
jgi:hypothetical protein